jgi:hypothetical protein
MIEESELPIATEIDDRQLLVVIAEPVSHELRLRRDIYRANARDLAIMLTITIVIVIFYILYIFAHEIFL